MKYFFLADSWATGRVWEFGGLWNEIARRRKPYLQKQSLCIQENGEVLWLYQTEDSVLMIEVKPQTPNCSKTPIGQVMLKRLLTAEQVIERLCDENVFQPHSHKSTHEATHKAAHEATSDVTHTLGIRSLSDEATSNPEPASIQDKQQSAINANAS